MSNPYLKQLKTVVFDIETMGLSAAKDMVINAGFCNPDNLSFVQLFAESVSDEEKLLKDIIKTLSEYDAVITYNGDSFDIPFIRTRCKKYGLEFDESFWSIDMYRYLKKYWPMAERLPRMNQKAVELALGLSEKRTDAIGGDECIPLYLDYLKTKNTEDKRLILLHNADDILQLAKIYNKSVFLPYDRIAFERGFAIYADELVKISSIRFDKNNLYVKAEKKPGGIPSSIYDDSYEFEYDSFTGQIQIIIKLNQRDNGMRYVDLTLLPCDKEVFKGLKGYFSDYLVLSDIKEVYYKEVNTLVGQILSDRGLY